MTRRLRTQKGPAPAKRRGRVDRPVVARFDQARFRWAGIPSIPYKATSNGSLFWKDVERFVLVGSRGEPTAFQLRYFEIAPRGYSSFERHRHAHAVLVIRGRGHVRVADAVHRVGPMDFVFIPPDVPHQFRAGREPFGFLCPVDAVRDRPQPVERPVGRLTSAPSTAGAGSARPRRLK
ncbi:MAG: cupin domain-containing protein [Armatimonadota bacterium]